VDTLTRATAGARAGAAVELIEVRLTAIRYAARDIHLFEFRRPDGSTLPAAEAGAHVDLHLPNGIVRQYSLTVPDPSPQTYMLGIKREPASRGGSRCVFEELRVGGLLNISPPRNTFPLNERARHAVFIAGGIGVTPIWAMVQRSETLGRSWELYYACRSRTDMAFFEELRTRAACRFHFDDEAQARFLDIGPIVARAHKDAHLYCCGPLPMLSAFEAATAGWPFEQVHVEYFTAKEEPNRDGGFVVHLARSNKEFVIPAGKTILEVLRDGGLNVPHSCQEGICGTCETPVISGIPDHRDAILTVAERAANKTVMICCAGSKTDRLVLDL
jgi:ferredoxin-NADP reductase